ncbi:MAG: adenylyl-sulfate kinase, partial [Alphaproteobacteria bacterium]|nr:adenylyl-sulfate kinase [Alphaproteobacteria bacterium]
MKETDQGAAIDFLADPANHAGAAVERISTHGAHVFLAGDRAYKIKKAVDLGFFDFTTLARRRHFLGRELVLNRAFAPSLYLRLRTVAREPDGRLAWDGAGAVVEWVLEMRRFSQSSLFDRMAREGRLTPAILARLADRIARIQDQAERRADHGGMGSLADVIDVAERRFREEPALAREPIDAVIGRARETLARRAPLLARRRASGFVRRCHGDFHLRNVCLVDGEPTPFDCLEFDDALSVIDIAYDVAFLLMDIRHRGLGALANLTLNRWLAWTADYESLGLLPLFLALRAMIRSHVSAAMKESEEALRYFRDAGRFLAPPPPMLVAIGGLSGSGKSTVAAALAPRLGATPGAAILRSDVFRKRLFDKAPEERLGPEAYAPSVSAEVYGRLETAARDCLAAGHAVIVDAVHLRPGERARIEEVARSAGAAFFGLWLDVPPETLRQRVADRRHDASDAT